MRAHDTERGNVTVRNTITGLLFHLCENVADDLGWVVGCLLRARYLERKATCMSNLFFLLAECLNMYSIGGATHIDGDVAELRPAHGMVHVVFAKVVFWQVGDVGLLDMRNVA